MAVRCEILGPLAVSIDGSPVRLGGVKERSVLVLLLLRAREVVSSDSLIDRLWGDEPPASAVNTLQTYVSRLRKALHASGDEVLVTRHPGYLLDVADEDVDACRFEALVRAGQHALAEGDPDGAAGHLREALALWRGPALGDFANEEFAAAEIRRLEEMRLAALEARIRADLDVGLHREVIPEVESLVREHPLREGLWASLMLALYRSGRQADALRAFQKARHVLAEELGIDPGPELRHLEESMLLQDAGLLGGERSGFTWSGNLPADLTSFVGRVEDLADLEELAGRSRLVTLLGPGGIGKSRLAVELARRMAAEFPDGAWVTDLASCSDPSSVINQIAALWPVPVENGGASVDSLGALLRARRALLLLDNCERVAEAVAPIAERLLAAAPSLRILATSREPLECRGELLWRVGPLGLASVEAPTVEAVRGSDAVELFTARVRDADPGFAVDERNAAAVARVCGLLEGIPLAIELAASQLRSMTLEELESRLDDRLGVLITSGRTVPARQRTLQQTIEWSYDLLDDDERLLFARLGTFWVEFPLRAVEVICTDELVPEETIARLLGRLADKSLVMRIERSGRTWYRMLETVRTFAFAKPTVPEIHQRGFLVHLAGRTDHTLRGPVDLMWATLLDGAPDVARWALGAAANSFCEDQGAELAGVVAALVSTSRRVGVICGLPPADDPIVTSRLDAVGGSTRIMRRFRDGFVAGVRRVDPEVEIFETHLSDRIDFVRAFSNPVRGGEAAAEIFASGADVVFQVAGGSGHRMFEIARRVTEDTGIHRWVIGVDFDEYQDAEEHLRPHVLASIRKQVPMDVYREIKRAVAEDRVADAPWFDLSNGGMSLATTGGHIDHLAAEIEAVRADIVAQAVPPIVRPPA